MSTANQWIVFIIAALTLLALLWKVGRAVSASFQGVDYIKREMQNNGGKTIRDSLDRIEGRLGYLETELGIKTPRHLKPPPHHERHTP